MKESTRRSIYFLFGGLLLLFGLQGIGYHLWGTAGMYYGLLITLGIITLQFNLINWIMDMGYYNSKMSGEYAKVIVEANYALMKKIQDHEENRNKKPRGRPKGSKNRRPRGRPLGSKNRRKRQ